MRNLVDVSSAVLETIRAQLVTEMLAAPITQCGLTGIGLRDQQELIEQAFAGLTLPACLAAIDLVLSERARRALAPELVWTGPEGPRLVARDTSVVLRALFEGAEKSVIVAGYRFDHPEEVLAPLYAVMKARGVSTRIFIDIDQITNSSTACSAHLSEHCGRFLRENWPFGVPAPRLFYDIRAIAPPPPHCSMHAKCVVVDGKRAFVSSANFTDRGQERNIEVGVLIEDPRFATQLAKQWDGLVQSGLVREYVF